VSTVLSSDPVVFTMSIYEGDKLVDMWLVSDVELDI